MFLQPSSVRESLAYSLEGPSQKVIFLVLIMCPIVEFQVTTVLPSTTLLALIQAMGPASVSVEEALWLSDCASKDVGLVQLEGHCIMLVG